MTMQIIRNISESCQPDDIPTMAEYFSVLGFYSYVIVAAASFTLLFVILIFCKTVNTILLTARLIVYKKTKSHTVIVLSAYPIVALAAYCTIIVPRAHLVSEAIVQGTFMTAMYHLFCLLIAYCDGESNLISKTRSMQVSLVSQVGPCCCWPCCTFLPQPKIDKKVIRNLRLLVLQLPIVQGLVYLILLVTWTEQETIYRVNYKYLQPLIIISILFGVWGMAMTVKMLKDLVPNEKIVSKFIVLQLVLIFAKLQGLITRLLTYNDWLPCLTPLTPALLANTLYNCLMLLEMLLLSVLAARLYTTGKSKSIGHDSINSISARLTKHNTLVCLKYQQQSICQV